MSDQQVPCPWGVYVKPEQNGNAPPTTLIVCKAGGQHVSERDAEWLRALIGNAKRENPTTETQFSTWEQKIECLVRLAKAVGRFTNAEPGTDYYNDARKSMFAAYDEFCEWRHDDPYIVDEIKALMVEREEKQ